MESLKLRLRDPAGTEVRVQIEECYRQRILVLQLRLTHNIRLIQGGRRGIPFVAGHGIKPAADVAPLDLHVEGIVVVEFGNPAGRSRESGSGGENGTDGCYIRIFKCQGGAESVGGGEDIPLSLQEKRPAPRFGGVRPFLLPCVLGR